MKKKNTTMEIVNANAGGIYAADIESIAKAIGILQDTHLSNSFNRIYFRKGRPAAVSATARKLAVIIWNMAVKNTL